MELNTIVSEVGTLVDIRDVSVKCGRFTVQASFSAEGATLEECIKGILR